LVTLGVMLAYTPLHLMLLREVGRALIATSGNVADQPILFREADATQALGRAVDFFLVHDREIASPADDSVVREIAGSEVVFRAGRGYAPLTIDADPDGEFPREPVLALGPHQKNSVAFARDGKILMAPHFGNLDSIEALDRYQEALARFEQM